MRESRLLADGAPIYGFGVGSKLGVSADAPQVDTAHKLAVFDGRPVLKRSTGKAMLPCELRRIEDGPYPVDVGARLRALADGLAHLPAAFPGAKAR